MKKYIILILLTSLCLAMDTNVFLKQVELENIYKFKIESFLKELYDEAEYYVFADVRLKKNLHPKEAEYIMIGLNISIYLAEDIYTIESIETITNFVNTNIDEIRNCFDCFLLEKMPNHNSNKKNQLLEDIASDYKDSIQERINGAKKTEERLSKLIENSLEISETNNIKTTATIYRVPGKNKINASLFYIPDILNSRNMAVETIKKIGNPPPKLLASYLPDDDSNAKLTERLAGILQNLISVEETEAGMITISISSGYEYTSDAALLINTHLEIANEKIIEMQSQYLQQQIEFYSKRIKNAEKELIEAEKKIAQFIRTNSPSAQDSPEGTLKRARLLRDVEIANEIYQEVLKHYETVKIEQIKQTAAFQILNNATSNY